jgi:histidinol dehydrogenase
MDALYPMLLTEDRTKEEWPSEKWNFQDNYGKSVRKVQAKSNPKTLEEPTHVDTDESSMEVTQDHIKEILTSVKCIGNKKVDEILEKMDTLEIVETLEEAPEKLKKEFSWFKKKMLAQLDEAWTAFKSKL